MFRLPPVKLWRVLALVWAAASVAASGVVTVCSAGPVEMVRYKLLQLPVHYPSAASDL